MNDVTLHHGDCLDVLRADENGYDHGLGYGTRRLIPDASVDAVVTDPPYGLGFMGKEWDALPPGEEWAAECLRVLKPGGHMLAFGGTRTWHRLAVAVEDAGFEVRDSIAWMYGAGFPKSMNLDRIKNSPFCRCNVGESGYADSDSATEHGLRDVPDADVSTAERTGRGSRSVLLEGVPESGAPSAGSMPAAGSSGRAERVMEGRRDLPPREGQLHRPEVRPLPTGVSGNGASGRLRHGAPPSDGTLGRSLPAADGSGQPQEPRPAGQPQGEPRAVPVERGSQAWGGWPVCERCSQPVIPAGLGTALKPAFEPIVVARKPLAGTVAANVLAHGTGALNVDGCRVAMSDEDADFIRKTARPNTAGQPHEGDVMNRPSAPTVNVHAAGRWPANVILDEHAAAELDQQSGEASYNPAGTFGHQREDGAGNTIYGDLKSPGKEIFGYGDTGGASRFFYVAKADATERVKVNGTAHPTVKPLALMRWLVRLVTPPGGTVLEPFAGSGTTVEACLLEGFSCIAIEREADYLPLIQQRINRRRDPVATIKATEDDAGLFDLLDGGAA